MSKPVLLYAEDDSVSRENYAIALDNLFSKILLASNGKEALELYHTHKPDIIILDVNMPQVNGLEVAKMIRESDLKTPILMLTGHSEKEILLKAIGLKLDGYLIKSAAIETLIEELRALIQKVSETKELSLMHGLHWNGSNHRLFHEDQEIKLTQKERLLLKFLCDHPGNYLSHDELIIGIWDEEIPDHTYNKKLTQLIYRLNKKVAPFLPERYYLIQNSYTLGYRVEPSPKRNME